MTVLVRQEVRSCPLYRQLTSHYRPIVEFRRFSIQVNIRVFSIAYQAIEPLAFHRVIALLRTDRNLEQNSCVLAYLHFPSRGQYRLRVFGPSRSVPSYLSSRLPPAQHCTFFFSPSSTLLCCHNMLTVRYPQVLFLKNWARKDFAHEVHLFWIIPPDCPFLSRNLIRTRCILRISGCVPPKRSISFSSFP